MNFCFRLTRVLVAVTALLLSGTALAQDRVFDIYIDSDNPGTGCDVNLANVGTTLLGVDHQISIIVDTGLLQVSDVSVASCAGASFGALSSIGGGYPVGLDNGVNGTDVVEFAASLAQLGILPDFDSLTFYVVGENSVSGDQDLLATTNGQPDGGPIRIFPFVPIPVLGGAGIAFLLTILLVTGLVKSKRYRRLTLLSIVLSSGVALAGTLDGEVNDWTVFPPIATDPADDPLPADDSGVDIQALFLLGDSNGIFGRIDVTDLENSPPVANPSTESTPEDSPLVITLSGNDPDGDPLTFAIVTPPTNGSLGAITPQTPTTATVTYTPNLDYNGPDSFTFRANDGVLDSPDATVDITVTPVNDEPSFTAPTNQSVAEDSPAQTVAAFVTASPGGGADEATQTFTYNVSNDNNALFSAQPAIDANGQLTYTPAADMNGVATVTVSVTDSGGTANPGDDDTSPDQMFTITVTPVNDEPSFTAPANQSVPEDSPAQTVPGFVTASPGGGPDEAAQTFTFNMSNNNNALFSAQPAIDASGQLTYTPAPNANGVATVTVSVTDSGGTANPGDDDTSPDQMFTITVTAVNDPPMFTAGPSPITVDEDSGAYDMAWVVASSVGPADEAGQTLSYIVTPQGALPASLTFTTAPAVNGTTGNLSFTPAANAYGTAVYNVQAMDNGGGTDTSPAFALTITVTPINDAPTVVGAGPTIDVFTNMQVSVPAASGLIQSITANDEATEAADGTTLSLMGSGGGPLPVTTTIGGTLSILADGSFTFNPPPGVTGMGTFTYSICDDGIGLPAIQCSADVTATVNVAGAAIWFIDNSAANPGDGRLTTPFNSLNAYNNAAGIGAGSTVFIHTGSGNYTDGANGMTTFNQQRIFGSAISAIAPETFTTFDQMLAITPPANTAPRPAIGGTAPVITAPNGDAFDMTIPGGGFIAIRGLNIGDTSNGYGMTGQINGTLNVRQVNISGPGGLVSLNGANTGTMDTRFGSLATTGSTSGNAFHIFDSVGSVVSATSTSISNPAATAIQLTNNTGGSTFNFGNLANITTTAGDGIFATNTGTVTIGNTSPSITAVGGAALFLGTSAFNGFTFSNLSASGGSVGLGIDTVTGNIIGNNGSITTTANAAIDINGGNNTITYTGSITNTANDSVEVTNRTGGIVTLSGIINDTGTGITANGNAGGTINISGTNKTINTGGNVAVNLTNNTGATINFTGGSLDIDTAGVTGFNATGGGTVTVQGGNNTVNSGSGTAINIANTNIGAANMTFNQVNSNGSTSGIVLNTTGTAGGLIVTGDGTTTRNTTGGTIQNTTGPGINLTNTTNPSFNHVRISATGADGIQGSNVTNLGFNHGTIVNAGNAVNESGIDIAGLFGTGSTINNSRIERSAEFNVKIENTSATNAAPGTPDRLTVTNSEFGDNEFSGVGADGIFYGALQTANMHLDVTGIDCTDCRTDGIQTDAGNSATMRFDLTTSDFSSNNIALNISGSNSGTVFYDVDNNTSFDDHQSNLINIAHGVGNGSVDGELTNNGMINNSATGNGVRIIMEGAAGAGPSARTLTSNNTITRFNLFGIQSNARAGTASHHMTIEDNVVSTPLMFAADGIRVESGNGTAGESNLVCLDIEDIADSGGGGNNSTTLAFDEGFEVQQRSGTTFQMEGLNNSNCGGGACNGTIATQVEEHIIDNNTGTANVRTAGRIVNYTHVANCTMPTL